MANYVGCKQAHMADSGRIEACFNIEDNISWAFRCSARHNESTIEILSHVYQR
jgi:hypothetical protein